MDITQLKEKLSDIHRMGYVVSLRKGNTGIGYTLETLPIFPSRFPHALACGM